VLFGHPGYFKISGQSNSRVAGDDVRLAEDCRSCSDHTTLDTLEVGPVGGDPSLRCIARELGVGLTDTVQRLTKRAVVHQLLGALLGERAVRARQQGAEREVRTSVHVVEKACLLRDEGGVGTVQLVELVVGQLGSCPGADAPDDVLARNLCRLDLSSCQSDSNRSLGLNRVCNPFGNTSRGDERCPLLLQLALSAGIYSC